MEECMNDQPLGKILRSMAESNCPIEVVLHDFGDNSLKELLNHFADLIELQYIEIDWRN